MVIYSQSPPLHCKDEETYLVPNYPFNHSPHIPAQPETPLLTYLHQQMAALRRGQ